MNTEHLDALKARLDARRPLPGTVVSNLREDLAVRWTYNSNAIEGNTLTLRETKVVLEGITVGGKSMKEHLEATNHVHAIDFIFELVDKGEPLTERTIKEVHALVLKGINDDIAGKYRTENVVISGADHVPPDHLHVAEQMAGFMAWYAGDGMSLHVVERAARLHVDLVKIHPFSDGNGRTARLLMNLELMQGGFPPIVVQNAERLAYYEALDTAHTTDNYAPFFDLTETIVEKSFEPYWFALGMDKEQAE
ncbi:MAG: Fic family protein [Pseudodesulfovibrio sp.]|nr:Fic family protein [Pseudodesulfovibrio sp.]